VRTTPRRGSIEHHYELLARPDITDNEWETLPDIVKHAMVGAALAPIGRLVQDAATAGGFGRREAHLSRTAVALDEQGWRDAAALLIELCERLDDVERASLERIAETGAEAPPPSTVVLMHFESPPVPEETSGAHDADALSSATAAL
jgi:hypothetical protein